MCVCLCGKRTHRDADLAGAGGDGGRAVAADQQHLRPPGLQLPHHLHRIRPAKSEAQKSSRGRSWVWQSCSEWFCTPLPLLHHLHRIRPAYHMYMWSLNRLDCRHIIVFLISMFAHTTSTMSSMGHA